MLANNISMVPKRSDIDNTRHQRKLHHKINQPPNKKDSVMEPLMFLILQVFPEFSVRSPLKKSTGDQNNNTIIMMVRAKQRIYSGQESLILPLTTFSVGSASLFFSTKFD